MDTPEQGWPTRPTPSTTAANVVLVLLDDIGFADTSAFGGPISTPSLDRLAREGVRFSNLNTAAMCSPTRAALLSGRNHHRVGFGLVADAPSAWSGYDTVWKPSTAPFAVTMKRAGYRTAAFGKWHNTPNWEITPHGPFDRWPTGLVFEYFYGFMGPEGAEDHWFPTKLFRNTASVDPPRPPGDGYHLTADLADEAIAWLGRHRSFAPDDPYLLYFATGAVHFPHQAPAEWIERFRGRFDRGWDVIREEIVERQLALGLLPEGTRPSVRPDLVPAWDDLPSDARRLFARQMEVYAGFVAHTDHEIGRLLDAVDRERGERETAVVMIVGDNGTEGQGEVPEMGAGWSMSAMSVADQTPYLDTLGSPEVSWNHYARGWAWLGSTPFPYWKTIASHLGAVRNPMIVSWPGRMAAPERVRMQFTHVTDVAPTILELAGISAPEELDGVPQEPFDGCSFAAMLTDPHATSQHRIQYFEITGNRSLYRDGWLASARHVTPGITPADFDADPWELYHLESDFAQTRDLAHERPELLAELRDEFDRQARSNLVYPLCAVGRNGSPAPVSRSASPYVYGAETPRIPAASIPTLWGRSFAITIELTVPHDGSMDGVVLHYGGWRPTLEIAVVDDTLTVVADSEWEWEWARGRRTVVTADGPLPPGARIVRVEFDPDTTDGAACAGDARILVDGIAVGVGRLLLPGSGRPLGALIGIGRNHGARSATGSSGPFPGVIRRVVVETGPDPQ